MRSSCGAEQLDKYQEQPQILDPDLDTILERIFARVWKITAARTVAQDEVAAAAAASSAAASSAAPVSPSRLMPFQLVDDPVLTSLLKVVYTLSKVRGYKVVRQLLPKEVSQLEPVLHLLQSQDREDYGTWETRYSLLLWLSLLVRVPFDLTTIDSTSASGVTLIDSLVLTGQSYLSDPGATRDMAAVFLSQLLTRPDMDAAMLGDFLKWADGVLISEGGLGGGAAAGDGDGDATAAHGGGHEDIFRTTGVLQALFHIFRDGTRDVLRKHVGLVLGNILTAVRLLSSPFFVILLLPSKK